MSVMRIGHVNLRVMDVDAARHHYEDVLGLIPTHQDASSNVYWKGWDERDQYSVVVAQADRAGMNHVAYKVEHNADLDEFQTRIVDYRIDVEEVPPGHLECCGCALRFQLSSEHQMYLDTETEYVSKAVATTNPVPWPDGLKGCGAHWLDHVLLMGELNPEQGIDKGVESTAFVQEVLGVRLVEQVMVGPEQSIRAATGWARTTTPHTSPLSVDHIWGFTIAPSCSTDGGMCSRPPMGWRSTTSRLT